MELDTIKGREQSTIEDLKQGRHWHLNRSQQRAMKVLTFCKALEVRLEAIPEDEQDVPLAHPLKQVTPCTSICCPLLTLARYVGYALCSSTL